MKQVAYNVRLKAKIDRRARLLSEAAIYYPFERLPAVRLDTYAGACLETVLKHSEDARIIYSKIVKCWELPSCQPVIDEFVKHTPNTRAWLSKVAKATVKNQTMPDFPNALVGACLKHQDNADFAKVLRYAGYLILVGFNRKIDLDNQTPKILPSQAAYLARAISFYSLFEYLQTNPLKPNPDHVMLGKMLYEFYQVMAGNPTTRKERQLKHEVVSTLRRRGYSLCHDDKMLKDAEQWYKCRVDPGTIEQYLSDESNRIDKQAEKLSPQEVEQYYQNERKLTYPERSNMEKAIAPCDEATGYPRKWRK